MDSASPICLMVLATSTKSWLWHQRLSLLNFDTINDLDKNDLVTGLPKFKYHKEHLYPLCEQGKSKTASHPPKPIPNSKKRLHLLYMDLCGPMRVESINGKRSKYEALEEIKTFLKKITVLLQAPVIIVRTNNGTEFKNLVLKEYFDSVGISSPKRLRITHSTKMGVVGTKKPNYSRRLLENKFDFFCALLSYSYVRYLQWYQPSRTEKQLIGCSRTSSSSDSNDIYNNTAPTPTNSSPQAIVIPNTSTGFTSRPEQQHAEKTITEPIGDNVYLTTLSVGTMEPRNVKEAMTDLAWIDSMQEELLQFKGLDVWMLVPALDNIKPLTLKCTSQEERNSFEEIPRFSVSRNGSYQDNIAYTAHKSFIGTVNMGLWYTKDSGFELTGFSDVDCAGCRDSFKSTFGGTQFLGEKLVGMLSKNQDCMTLLTAEAEYVFLSACCSPKHLECDSVNTVVDVPHYDNPTPLKAFKDHSEIVVNSNNDDTSSDDDDFEDIEYVEESPPDLEIISLEE
ncbi:retrovirus-related pol polyprotein from transposon TNT 1-94 [Tanacetum coccineum]|uniref:Retrovirus-related pol polyprotein from transposon TNT 1-94 n=1 Tax=Tanacetum coccineum TaxID=301880 RepID=A0ABQ5B047_9ASTR